MLLLITKFGGLASKYTDPALLPDDKAQTAENCRFDLGGLSPLQNDEQVDSLTKAGAKTTLYAYHTGGQTYFFSWTSGDGYVYVVNCPEADEDLDKVYFTIDGELRCTDKTIYNLSQHVSTPTTEYPGRSIVVSPPAPTGALSYTVSVSGTDPTLLETRAYVYTFVNGWGNEGPPSPVSSLVSCYDGNWVQLTGFDTAPDTIADDDYHWITKKRIYRLNQNASSTAQYQFVHEMDIDLLLYNDTVLDAALGEVLPSTEWDPPPDGITGIVLHPGGFLVGFDGNVLCMSEPKYPHAWPVAYQKVFDDDIVRLGVYGSTIVVTTKGTPYLMIGDHPANMVVDRMDMGYANVSEPGGAQCGDVFIYPTDEGLVAIGPNGRGLITQDIFDYHTWQKLYPSTLVGSYWDGAYVFKTARDIGYMFDLKRNEFSTLDLDAEALYFDSAAGQLYYVEEGSGATAHKIVKRLARMETAGSDRYNRSLNWKSKRFRFPKTTLKVLKVLANAYPITIKVTFPGKSVTQTKTVTSAAPVRLATYLVDSCEVEISEFANQVTAIYLASTMEEMPQ